MRVETYIREADPEDMPFVYSSWLKSLQPFMHQIDKRIFFKQHKNLIDSILRRSSVMISCNPHEKDQIFGYVVYEPGSVVVMHYIYTKHTYRRLGIANELYDLVSMSSKDNAPMIASHYSLALEEFLTKWDLIFNPYILLEQAK